MSVSRGQSVPVLFDEPQPPGHAVASSARVMERPKATVSAGAGESDGQKFHRHGDSTASVVGRDSVFSLNA